MQKPSLSALSVLIATLSFASTGFADQTVRITQTQETFTLQLKANATTGYQWFLDTYNSTYFTFLGYHYLAPNSLTSEGKPLVGAPGVAQFTFQVNPAFHQGPLTSKIHLIYGQPWDMTATTDTTVTLVSQPPIAPVSKETAPSSDQPLSSPSIQSDNPDTPPTMTTVTDSPTATTEPSMLKKNTSTEAQSTWLSLPETQS
jgi:predicted secreted protein